MGQGIHHLYVETHDWNASVAFWRALGFELAEGWGTGDPPDGILSASDGSMPYVFLRQVPRGDDVLAFDIVFGSTDLDAIAEADGVRVDRARHASGWGPDLLRVGDPDWQGADGARRLTPGVLTRPTGNALTVRRSEISGRTKFRASQSHRPAAPHADGRGRGALARPPGAPETLGGVRSDVSTPARDAGGRPGWNAVELALFRLAAGGARAPQRRRAGKPRAVDDGRPR